MANKLKPSKPPAQSKSERLTSALLRAVRKVERERQGTGYTILKQQASPLMRLLDKHKIGPQELQAAEDISRAFHAIASALMFRPLNMERSDRSTSPVEPVAVLDAVARYKEWAAVWSKRAKRGDPTLSIVIAVVVDERPLRVLDMDLVLKNGTAAKALIAGLKDYAARAKWARGGLVEGGAVFRLRAEIADRRQAGMRALARKWDVDYSATA